MDPGRLFSDPTAAPAAPRQMAPDLDRPDPVEALARLRAGNARFAAGASLPDGAGPRPYAVVVGCIDPRVPVEAVFGQGAGAVCVVRSAGHVLDRAVLGSVEFAVTELQVSLVFVLGHDDCRAVAAAYQAARTGRRAGGARQFLIDQIAPGMPAPGSPGGTLDQATRSHLRRTVTMLRHADSLREALAARRIDVVGGIYRMNSGRVEIL